MQSTSDQYCTFFIDDMFLGVPVKHVREVVRHQDMTSVPHAQPTIRGLINLRGQIVTALDLRRRFGLPDFDNTEESMNVLIITDDEPVSLLVDQIGDVLELNPAGFEPCPSTLRGVARGLISGVQKLDNRLLLLLDIDKTLDVDA